MNSERPERLQIIVVQGIGYRVVNESGIRDHLFRILLPEWGQEAFDEERPEMERWSWKLATLKIDCVKLWGVLMRDATFISELEKRVKTLKDLISRGVAIEPIVVRGRDMVIFDGYARLQSLKQLGKNEVLAYIGRKNTTP